MKNKANNDVAEVVRGLNSAKDELSMVQSFVFSAANTWTSATCDMSLKRIAKISRQIQKLSEILQRRAKRQ